MSSSAPYQRKAPWDRSNKYWCQYCRIYVHDNRSSRSIHESGSKHKTNVQAYLRQIEKATEAKNKEELNIASQLEAIERAAEASYRRDIGNASEPSTYPTHGTHPATHVHDSPSSNKMRRSDDHSESAAVDSSEAAQPSRPPDMGVAGAWEVVEEPSLLSNHTSIAQEDSCSKTIDRSADGPNDQDMRGAEWLDDEDRDHDHALTDFKITEKKLGHTSPDPHTAATPDNVDHPKDGGSGDRVVAAKNLFKRRRVASNRASSRNQRKKT